MRTASSGLKISKLGLYVKSTICCHKKGIDPRTYKKVKIDDIEGIFMVEQYEGGNREEITGRNNQYPGALEEPPHAVFGQVNH